MIPSNINDIDFKPHTVFKGGIAASVEVGRYIVSIISGGQDENNIGGAYGRIVEDFTADGVDYSNSTFEVGIIDKDSREFVTQKLFPSYCGGDEVAPRLSAKEVMGMIDDLNTRVVVQAQKHLSGLR